MHTIAVVLLGLCAVSIAGWFRKAGWHLLATLYALGCAVMIVAILMHWPMALRVPIFAFVTICVVVGGIKMRKRGLL